MDNFNLVPMRLRNWLEFSTEENKELDMLEKMFPYYLEMTAGNGNKNIRILYPCEKADLFKGRIKFLDKNLYTLKGTSIFDDVVEFTFERTHTLERANKIGSLFIRKWDEWYFWCRHSDIMKLLTFRHRGY